MTEYVPREEFEELKAEVEELKQQINGSSGSGTSDIPGLDHRDERVLEHIRENGDKGPIRTVKLYQQITDISKRKTAKTRAENLRGHPEFQKVTA